MPGDEKKKPEEQQDNNEPEKKQDDVNPTDTDTNPKDKPEEKPAGDDGKKEEPEKKEEKPTEEPSDKDQGDENGEGADVPPADTPPAEDSVNLELLNTKAQLAAIKSGIRVDVVEDAVCLAMHDAKKNGELTEESVAEALSGVLSRHPEWKNAPENTNNFRVGGDGSQENPSSNDEISKIFGNV